MNLNTVATALASAIETATGMTCYDHAPADPNIPSLWIQPPDSVEYETNFGRGAVEVFVTVSSAVKAWNEKKGQEDLRTLLTSIKTAFSTDNTLSGSCSRAKVVSAELVSTQIGSSTYLGYDFTISVLG